MALQRESLVQLAKATAKASLNPSVSFAFGDEKLSYEALDSTFRNEMKELAGTPALYRQNKNTIFELIEIMLTEVLPPKVLSEYGQFAEIRTFAQGDRPIFYQRISEASRARAKQFVTKVGLAGRYEVFRLDGASLEVPTSAFGGAAQIAFEEFLDGRIDMATVYDIVLEGMDEAVYKEIAKALGAMATAMASASSKNYETSAGFSEAAMDKLLMIADTYGKASILCTFEFAATMIPQTGWVSDNMRDRRWNLGYLGDYKGHSVIVLPQSFEDTTNSKKVLNPQNAYIIPGGAEKPVKVAFEGSAQVKEVDGDDWSKTIHTYQKFGVAVYSVNPGLCIYNNSSLSQTVA